jgi:hypothetical protein
MAYLSLYSASITQTGVAGPTSSIYEGKSAVTATWKRLNTGSYELSSSGLPDFSGISGSTVGALALSVAYKSTSSFDTASILLYVSSSTTSSLFLSIQSNPYLGIYKDNILFGSCSIDIGINY